MEEPLREVVVTVKEIQSQIFHFPYLIFHFSFMAGRPCLMLWRQQPLMIRELRGVIGTGA
jgi:hypothetical protein